jgi:hypothetical protein
VAWIGAQSRYQLVAVGMAVSLLVGWDWVRRRVPAREAAAFAAGAAAALSLAAPFYLADWRWFGNPVWPLMVRPVNHLEHYRDRVADHLNVFLGGSFAPGALARSVAGLLLSPTTFPVPAMAVFACAGGLFARDPRLRRVAGAATLFLLLWLLMQPALYPRFAVILAGPAALGTAAVLARADGRPALRRLLRAGLGAGVAGLAAVTAWYSADTLRYVATGDADAYHLATWYYPVYRWANAATAPDARFLLVVNGGPSYYLERPYRRADPLQSGEVDWEAMRTPGDLHALLTRQGYRYLIFDDRKWAAFVGGANMTRLVHQAMRQGLLTPVRTFRVRLVISRMRGQGMPATVHVLGVAPAAGRAGASATHAAQPPALPPLRAP